MSPAIHTSVLLPMWLAMIAAQPSAGNAESEPHRPTSSRKCVDLLPPETIGPEEVVEASCPLPIALRDRIESSPLDLAESVASSRFSPRFDETRMGLLIMCAGVAAGGLWIAFVHRRTDHVESNAASLSATTVDADLLKPLIANALPVIAETLIFPRMARLHGRPIANDRYRFDAAQPLGEPHFTPTPGSIEVDVDVVHWVSAAEPGVKEPSFRRFGPSPLERALAAAEGERP